MNSTKKSSVLSKSASKLPTKLSFKKPMRADTALDDISNFSSKKTKPRKATPRKIHQSIKDEDHLEQPTEEFEDELTSDVDVESLQQQLEYLNDEVLEHLKSSKEKDKLVQMLKERIYCLEKEKEDEISQHKNLENVIKSLKMRNKELSNDNLKAKSQLKEFERKLEDLSKKSVVVAQTRDKDMPFVGDRRGDDYVKNEIAEKKEIEEMMEELTNIQEKSKEISNIMPIEEIMKMAWEDYYKEEEEKKSQEEPLWISE